MSIIQGVGSGEVSTGFYPHSIDQSLIFNDNDNPYLEKTLGTPTNNKKFTISMWIKRANLGGSQMIISAGTSGASYIQFQSDDTIKIRGNNALEMETARTFKDTGSWYHIVFVFDSANGTDTLRARLYVNGTEITDFNPSPTRPNINEGIALNSAVVHHIGNYSVNENFDFDGYLAEMYLVDGQALTPSSFAETKNDIWIPKETSISTSDFGDNGFHLTFSDTSNIGADSSGNGNNFVDGSTIAFTADSVTSDSPTDNFCVMNPIGHSDGATPGTLSDGNLVVDTGTAKTITYGTFAIPTSGKYYFEITAGTTNSTELGLAVRRDGSTFRRFAYRSNGDSVTNTTVSSSAPFASFTSGNIIGVAVDSDTPDVEFFKNGTSQGSINIDFSLDSGDLFPFVTDTNSSASSIVTFNFGTKAFNGTDGSGTVPSGFTKKLSTADLPNPAIDPNVDETPDQYMDPILYTPNNGTLSVTGLEFQPDWVWIKDVTTNISHAWFDVLRGTATAGSTNTAIGSNRTDAEGNGNGVLSSFNSDGFTVDGGSSGSQPRSLVNKGTTANDYVAWTWKAGGAPTADNSAGVGATPTAGSVKIDGANLGSALAGTLAATRISANTESGFSIVKWTATGSVVTVAHGLSQKPEMIIYKSIDVSVNWIIGHAGNPNGFSDRLQFTNGDVSSNSDAFNSTEPTNQVMTIGSFSNTNNKDHIAYVFHSVDGFSKFSHYVGNGATDGTFVFTGFRPAFVMIKSNDSSTDWSIFDNARSPDNIANEVLEANESLEQSTNSSGPNLLSNGFKVKGNVGNWNHDGERYIYMAFADQPLKYSNAR